MERLLMGASPELLETDLLTAAEYPIRFSEDRLDRGLLPEMNWRWHPDLEFSVVLGGTVDFFVEDSCERLSAGQGILKNSNVLYRSHCRGDLPAVRLWGQQLFQPPVPASRRHVPDAIP